MELAKNRIYEMIKNENSKVYSQTVENDLKRELYKIFDKYYDISEQDYDISVKIIHK